MLFLIVLLMFVMMDGITGCQSSLNCLTCVRAGCYFVVTKEGLEQCCWTPPPNSTIVVFPSGSCPVTTTTTTTTAISSSSSSPHSSTSTPTTTTSHTWTFIGGILLGVVMVVVVMIVAVWKFHKWSPHPINRLIEDEDPAEIQGRLDAINEAILNNRVEEERGNGH